MKNEIPDINRVSDIISLEDFKAQLANKQVIYIINSTLNQAVNYIPAKLLDIDTDSNIILNITLCNDEYFDERFQNCKWDEYLKNKLPAAKFIDLQVDRQTYNNSWALSEQIECKLKELNLSGSVIVWNITGGQRPFVLAAQITSKEKTTRDYENYLIYLEGNSGQMMIYDNQMKILQVVDYSVIDNLLNTKRVIQELNINDEKKQDEEFKKLYLRAEFTKELFALMGFEFNDVQSGRSILIPYTSDEIKIISTEKFKDFKSDDKKLQAYAYIKAYEYKDKYREINQIWLNFFNEYIKKSDSHLRKKLIQSTNDKETEEIIKESFSNKYLFLKYSGSEKTRSFFGYILENMVFFKLLEDYKNEIVDIRQNLQMVYLTDKIGTIDEIDIIVINKFGQMIIFELKSGGMTSDVAKSTKFTSYRVAGVYGLPILITPLIKDEIAKMNSISYISDNVKKAIYSAKRAGLEVWGIDEITERIKPYLGI